MKEYTDIEIQRAKLLKAATSAIRLKHSLRADEEIKRKLPQLEREITLALESGRPFELQTDTLLEDR